MRGKIVIIDDDITFLRGLSTYLKGRGFDVLAYELWDMSIIKVLRNTDVIIVDINLPLLSGYDILSYIRTRQLNTKVMIITGDDSLPRRLRSFALGANDYLKKPIYPAEIAARINQYCLLGSKSTDKEINKIFLSLTKRELALFKMLLNSQGNLVKLAYTSDGKSVYTAIFRLKQKLINTRYSIVSSYGQGWKLIKKQNAR